MTNRDLVDGFYRALSVMDVDGFAALHHPQVVYNISGQTSISGRYASFDALMELLPAVFDALDFENFHFARKWEILSDDGTRITAIMEAEGMAKNGERYDQRYFHIFGFRDGKIGEVFESFDTQLAIKALGLGPLKDSKAPGPFALQDVD